ncbi:MAG: hypothetical protein K9N38_08795 [Candidatus Marinimicrobia bacterium]|nr:hypothetical protein [Candidatus Neomarinimicrobiota bacterium]MCF7851263.1 hypothetical protein [Candidatus Neomarinimicrobiota bacterium]
MKPPLYSISNCYNTLQSCTILVKLVHPAGNYYYYSITFNERAKYDAQVSIWQTKFEAIACPTYLSKTIEYLALIK